MEIQINILKGVVANLDLKTLSLTKDSYTLKYLVQSKEVSLDGDIITLNDSKKRQLHTDRAIILNNMKGLIEPFTGEITLKGTGYKVELKDKLYLFVGYSNKNGNAVDIPDLVKVEVTSLTSFKLSSPCKNTLGSFKAYICSIRKVNLYKGFGIRDSNKAYNFKVMKK